MLPVTSPYKLSTYTVASQAIATSEKIHPFVLVLSTRTNAVIELPEVHWQYLQTGKINHLPKNEIDLLLKHQILVDHNENELESILAENQHAIDTTEVLYESIMPSAWCQLGCDYCGQNHTHQLLNNTHQTELIERINNKLLYGNYTGLHVSWFGGEPLTGLPIIKTLSDELITLCKHHNIQYGASIVTNGLALTKDVASELLHQYAVLKAEVTLDGPAAIHDQRRDTKHGAATFDKIFSNLCAIAKDSSLNELTITLRCNVDERNFEYVPELITSIATSPLKNRVQFYTAPIHNWGNDAAKKGLTRADFAKQEINWLSQMIRAGLKTPLMPARKPVVCVAVSKDGEVTSPTGQRHKCSEWPLIHQSAIKTPHLIASDALAYDAEWTMRTFNQAIADEAFDCNECAMLPVCGGACPKSWLDGHAPCPSAKFNMHDRLLLAYAAQRLQQKEAA